MIGINRPAATTLLLLMTSGRVHAATQDQFSLYLQSTYVEQETLGFRDPYHGPNSLTPNSDRETLDITAFAGARLWPGAEFWVNMEVDQGYGLDNTTGVAGFPSAEAYKVGSNSPYLRLARAFLRQAVNLGDPADPVDPAPNQVATSRSPDRLVLTVGKLSVVDIFDTNQYAHDPRGDFLNWSIVDTGSFDYAADAWGYSVGAAAEWYADSWALRVGVFDLSDIPNSTRLDPGFHEFQMVGEIERRYPLFGQSGRIMLTAFDSRGRMGLLDEGINIAATRQYRSRLGVSLDLEQPLSSRLGMFARVGKATGNVETYEFSDIDRTAATGLSLKGVSWGRPSDTFGLAGVINAISGERERFLNAGGLGLLVADGKLPHPGPEKIVETYYDTAVSRWIQLTLDYQYVCNPAYNRDRGPVSVWAFRAHVQW
jgi:high affinity Mn2+ porin